MSGPIRNIAARLQAAEDAEGAARKAERAIFEFCNPCQRPFVADEGTWVSLLCPRRSGKTVAMLAKALRKQIRKPGTRVLIISLTLKSTRENYWAGAPMGLFKFNELFDLGMEFNHTDSVWRLPNGSRGRLAGAETKADVEYLRGAAAEADIAIVDECKSFAPELLQELIRDVLEPGLMTREGQLILGGTPGSIPMGPFYEATSPLARHKEPDAEPDDPGRITCVPAGATGPLYDDLTRADRDALWSLHRWTVADNIAAPKQWARALRNKARSGWSDDHPTWRREYMGEWVIDDKALVYHAYVAAKAAGKGTWRPNGAKEFPTEGGPWHLVMGLDFGFEDDNALVLAGYSETRQELRHIYDFKSPHMTADEFATEILWAIDRYGVPEMIVGDVGGLGKMLVETINQRYGLAIQPAEKREKYDHIELLNSDFAADRVRVIEGSDLDHELSGLQWDLSNESRMILARTGKLREDPQCPNHLCDALLYLWRFTYHYWSRPRHDAPERGTPQWYDEQQKAIEARIAARGPKPRFAGMDRLREVQLWPHMGLIPRSRGDA